MSIPLTHWLTTQSKYVLYAAYAVGGACLLVVISAVFYWIYQGRFLRKIFGFTPLPTGELVSRLAKGDLAAAPHLVPTAVGLLLRASFVSAVVGVSGGLVLMLNAAFLVEQTEAIGKQTEAIEKQTQAAEYQATAADRQIEAANEQLLVVRKQNDILAKNDLYKRLETLYASESADVERRFSALHELLAYRQVEAVRGLLLDSPKTLDFRDRPLGPVRELSHSHVRKVDVSLTGPAAERMRIQAVTFEECSVSVQAGAENLPPRGSGPALEVADCKVKGDLSLGGLTLSIDRVTVHGNLKAIGHPHRIDSRPRSDSRIDLLDVTIAGSLKVVNAETVTVTTSMLSESTVSGKRPALTLLVQNVDRLVLANVDFMHARVLLRNVRSVVLAGKVRVDSSRIQADAGTKVRGIDALAVSQKELAGEFFVGENRLYPRD